MGHAQIFRGLTGSTSDKERSLNEGDLLRYLQEAFATLQDLDEEEVKKLADVVLVGCDPEGNGTIEKQEYISAASRIEALRMEEVAEFFDHNRRKSFMEHIFGD